MKKVLLSFLLVIAATLAFTSCGGSKGSGSDAAAEKGASTAREAVERLSDALKNKDMDAAFAVMCNKNGAMLDDKDKESIASNFEEKYAGWEIQIVEEDVIEEGKEVGFGTILKKDGKEDGEGVRAFNIDGRWYAAF